MTKIYRLTFMMAGVAMKKLELYVCDTETTGIGDEHSIIEITLCRLSTNELKTWCIKPFDTDNIQAEALRINGHKLENLKHQTKYGQETYLEPSKVIVDIENWLMYDFHTSEERVLVAHNANFDKQFIVNLWDRCNSTDTFPFNKKLIIDTMQIQLFLEVIGKVPESEYYNLMSLVEKYSVKKEKSHSSDGDVKMCRDVFLKQAAAVGAADKFWEHN
jgi:DNA polymerase III epsilon subunit-like protein